MFPTFWRAFSSQTCASKDLSLDELSRRLEHFLSTFHFHLSFTPTAVIKCSLNFHLHFLKWMNCDKNKFDLLQHVVKALLWLHSTCKLCFRKISNFLGDWTRCWRLSVLLFKFVDSIINFLGQSQNDSFNILNENNFCVLWYGRNDWKQTDWQISVCREFISKPLCHQQELV